MSLLSMPIEILLMIVEHCPIYEWCKISRLCRVFSGVVEKLKVLSYRRKCFYCCEELGQPSEWVILSDSFLIHTKCVTKGCISDYLTSDIEEGWPVDMREFMFLCPCGCGDINVIFYQNSSELPDYAFHHTGCFYLFLEEFHSMAI